MKAPFTENQFLGGDTMKLELTEEQLNPVTAQALGRQDV